MKIEGKLLPPGKKERLWGVEIDSIGVFTQGSSEKNAYAMAAEAIELLAEDAGLKFRAVVEKSTTAGVFTVNSSDVAQFVSFVLRRMRETRHITLMELSDRLGSSSPNAYARYEQGKACPSIEKLHQLLKALDPSVELLIKVGA